MKSRKKNQTKTKTKTKAEALEKAKEEETFPAWIAQLAGGLVHELKNPLSTIKMNLQLLEEELENANTPREKRNLKKIQSVMEEINRLHNILDDFLRFSRSQKLECSEGFLNGAVEDVLSFIEPEALQSQVKILKNLDSSLPLIQLDKNLIKQAILNLVLNALQAMPNGGELIVETFLRDRWICLEVTDTGTGIPKERLQKIWDVYFSSKKTGTGLGLPTTLKIVEAHGGTIAVQSEENKGSQFTLCLPLHPEALV